MEKITFTLEINVKFWNKFTKEELFELIQSQLFNEANVVVDTEGKGFDIESFDMQSFKVEKVKSN